MSYHLLARLNQIQAAKIENTIEGLSVPVITWHRELSWKNIQVGVKDTTLGMEKRDQYRNRSDLCDLLQREGSVDIAVAYAPSVAGAAKARHYAVKCSLCGSGHNWCVFYRSAKTGKYLGHSGLPCFEAVLGQVNVTRADAVLKEIKRSKGRLDKYRATMVRVNDFKADFPGLYENREVLLSSANPYRGLFNTVVSRLAHGKPINEKWLGELQAGCDDRRRYNHNGGGFYVDESARRIPKMLLVMSKKSTAEGIDTLLAFLKDRHEKEEAEKTPVVSKTTQVIDNLAKAEELGGDWEWSSVVRSVRESRPLSEKAQGIFDNICAQAKKLDTACAAVGV